MISTIYTNSNGADLVIGDEKDAKDIEYSDWVVIDVRGRIQFPDSYGNHKNENMIACDVYYDWITTELKNKKNVMIHCSAGIERSPLVVAYFLWNMGFKDNMSDVYVHIKKIRPCVQDRLTMLPDWIREY